MRQRYSLGIGYLYSPWHGKLREYKGELIHYGDCRDYEPIVPERTFFLVQDEHGRVIKKLQCSSVEGEVSNKLVWFYERNWSGAAEALIKYEELRIAKLELEIENHRMLIETLKSIE